MEPYSWRSSPKLSNTSIQVIPSFEQSDYSANDVEIIQEEEYEVGLKSRSIKKRRRRQRRFSAVLFLLGTISFWYAPEYLPIYIGLLGCSLILLLSSFLDKVPLVSSSGSMDKKTPALANKKQVEVLVWGAPGDGLTGAERWFGKVRTELGVRGEEATARFLQVLLDIPGVRILHGMSFPGSRFADVDHIVISGNRVVIIDSKMWKPCQVSWLPSGQVQRKAADGRQDKMDMSIHEAVKLYETHLVEEWVNSPLRDQHAPEVRGIVVVHSTEEGKAVALDPSSHEGVVMASAQDAVEMIGRWFIEGQVGVVDRRILGFLLSLKKSCKG